MRDYGKVSPQFWTGETGRTMRGDPNMQVVALYLMTSPHANMIGVFHCPLVYISHETGIPLGGATKALQSLCEGGFCEYEAASEYVFVVRMAAYQIGDTLKPDDNRVKGLRKEIERIPESRLKTRFLDLYANAFSLSDMKALGRGLQDPPKPRAGTGDRTRTVSKSARADTRFEEFWSLYPNKTARKVCAAKWKARRLDEHADVIIADVKAKAADDRRWLDGFAPNPETYLNQDRWNDPVQPRLRAAAGRDDVPDFMRGAI